MLDLINDKKKRTNVMLLALALTLLCFGLAYMLGVYSGPIHEELEKPFMMVLFGFVGCWVLIITAKLIMSPLLQRDEDYYQKGDEDPDV